MGKYWNEVHLFGKVKSFGFTRGWKLLEQRPLLWERERRKRTGRQNLESLWDQTSRAVLMAADTETGPGVGEEKYEQISPSDQQ